jgi:hypothetical protein
LADDYRPLSINARLAAALHALTQVVRRTGLAHADVTALIDHVWSWPCVGPDTFDAWYAFEFPALPAPGDELASDLQQECRRVGVDPADLRQLLEHTAEIVYHGLFSVADNAESLAHLTMVEAIASRYGAALPPAALFAESPWSAHHGWGSKLLPTDVDRWRALTWPTGQ